MIFINHLKDRNQKVMIFAFISSRLPAEEKDNMVSIVLSKSVLFKCYENSLYTWILKYFQDSLCTFTRHLKLIYAI